MKLLPKLALSVLLGSTLFVAAERFAHYSSGGFTILNITDPHPHDPRWDTPPPTKTELEEIRSLLDMRYYYLAPGGQSFAFVSENGKYVLKLTKHKRMRVPLWAQKLPLFGALQTWREKTAAKKKRIFDCTFKSYLLAEKHLKRETGIIFLHLNKTDYLKKQITIVDKIGIEFKLNLDDFAFILQHKATLFYPYIEKLLSTGDVETAKERIKEMMYYLVGRAKQGIEDHDHCFETNLAFLNDHPFQLDIGSLRLNDHFKLHPVYCTKLREYSEELGAYLSEHHPELSSYFGQLIESMLNDPNL